MKTIFLPKNLVEDGIHAAQCIGATIGILVIGLFAPNSTLAQDRVWWVGGNGNDWDEPQNWCDTFTDYGNDGEYVCSKWGVPDNTKEVYVGIQNVLGPGYSFPELPDDSDININVNQDVHINSYQQQGGIVNPDNGYTFTVNETFEALDNSQFNITDGELLRVGEDVIVDNSSSLDLGSGLSLELFGSGEQNLSPNISEMDTLIATGGGRKNLQNDLTVTNGLEMQDGNIHTNGYLLTLGYGTAADEGGRVEHISGSVIGSFRRWIETVGDTYLFPIGNEDPDDNSTLYHRPAFLDFSDNAPDNGGTVTLEFIQQNPGYDGLPLAEAGRLLETIGTTGFWRFEAAGAMDSDDYEYDIELTAAEFIDVFDTTRVHTVIRDGSSSPWELRGDHLQSSAVDGDLVIRRDNLTGFSDFTAAGEAENPLPVEFAGAGIRTGTSAGQATITWKTATETENYRFFIDRAYLHEPDGAPAEDTLWTEIGSVKGQGTTSDPHSYRFEDTGLDKAGRYVYRIRQADYDGTEAVLTTLELLVDSPNRTELMENYPNPFNPVTHIPYRLAEGGRVSLKIYNNLGQRVATLVDGYRQAGQYEVRFDAASLPSGSYYILLEANGFRVGRSVTLIK